MCPHVRGLGIGLGYWLSRRHRIPNLNTHSIATYNARPFFRQTMCLRMCPRSRPPHREKNYIKLPVRDFVSPFNAAWSLLKQGWQKDRVREQIMSVDPCAFGGPNCRKVATTATEQGVPMCEPCLQQYKFGKFDQFQDPSFDVEWKY